MNINEPRRGGHFVLPWINTNKKHRPSTRPGSMKSNRLPFLNWIPDSARNHFVATSAEFVGTVLFLFFAFSGTQVALLSQAPTIDNVVGSVSDPAQLLFIALSFGFSLAVNAWVFFRISGGLFNPAVTLGMCLVGALPYVRGLFLLVAQIVGGIVAAAICSALFPGPLTVRTNLGGGTSVTQGLFIEMFLTAELVFTIFMLAAEKHKGTFIAPIGIGLSLFVAELTGVYFTGGSVNPARSFGPSVVTRQFHSYHWIYWVGPILGSLLASGFYKFIKMLEYETANPGQDRSKTAGEHFNPDEHTEKARVSFAPEEYAMEEGRVMRSDGGVMEPDGTGDPHEYGRQQRPYSKSPAPPHANDQYAGLDGGMHSDDQQPRYYPHNSIGADSDRTVVVPTANSSLPTANPSTHANVQDGFERNPVVGTNGRNKGVQSTPKAGTLRKTPSLTTPPRSSGNLKTNTYYNRNIGSGPGEGPDDEEFYDKN